MSSANLPLQFIAVALLVFGCTNAFHLLQQYQADGAVEPLHLLYTGLPIAGAALASGTGGMTKLFDWVKQLLQQRNNGGGSRLPGDESSLDLLHSLNTIIQQFKTKGIPDAAQAAFTWGADTFEASWAKKKTKSSPNPPAE